MTALAVAAPSSMVSTRHETGDTTTTVVRANSSRRGVDGRLVRSVVGLVLVAGVALVIFTLLFVGSVEFGRMLGFGDLAYLFPFTAEFPVLVATLCWWELRNRKRSTVYPIICFGFFLLMTMEYQAGFVLLLNNTDPTFLSVIHILAMTQAAIALALVVHLMIGTYAPEVTGTAEEIRQQDLIRQSGGEAVTHTNVIGKKDSPERTPGTREHALAVAVIAERYRSGASVNQIAKEQGTTNRPLIGTYLDAGNVIRRPKTTKAEATR